MKLLELRSESVIAFESKACVLKQPSKILRASVLLVIWSAIISMALADLTIYLAIDSI